MTNLDHARRFGARLARAAQVHRPFGLAGAHVVLALDLYVRPGLLLQESDVLAAAADDEPDLAVRDRHRRGHLDVRRRVPAPTATDERRQVVGHVRVRSIPGDVRGGTRRRRIARRERIASRSRVPKRSQRLVVSGDRRQRGQRVPSLDRVLPLRRPVASLRGGLDEPPDHVRRHHRLVLAAQERDPAHAVYGDGVVGGISVRGRRHDVVDPAGNLTGVARDVNRAPALVLKVHHVRPAFSDDEAHLGVWDVNLPLLPRDVEGRDGYAVLRGGGRHGEGASGAAVGPGGGIRVPERLAGRRGR